MRSVFYYVLLFILVKYTYFNFRNTKLKEIELQPYILAKVPRTAFFKGVITSSTCERSVPR